MTSATPGELSEVMDVNLNRARRLPFNDFWRLSNGLEGKYTDVDQKKKSTKWPMIIRVSVLVVFAIAAVIVLNPEVSHLKNKTLREIANDSEHDTFNSIDPTILDDILEIPQSVQNISQDDLACPLSMAKLPIKYSGLVDGSYPSTVPLGVTVTLKLNCAGTWWSETMSYNMTGSLIFSCIIPGETLGPSASMDIECIQYQIPDNFFTPMPNNIVDEAVGSFYGSYNLSGGPLNVFDYKFSSVYVSKQLGTLVFGGRDDSVCHQLPITTCNTFDVIIMMFDLDIDQSPWNKMFMGDTNDSTVVNHFGYLACAAHAGLCPDWQPNRAFVMSVLGVSNDDINEMSGSWQQAIVTNGTKSYFVGTYGTDISYNQTDADCGLPHCGAVTVVNRNKFRYYTTPVTSIYESQHRRNKRKVGTWIVPLGGFGCKWDGDMLGNFDAQIGCCDSTVPTTESVSITHTCMSGMDSGMDPGMDSGMESGYIHKYSGTDMNPGTDTLTCKPEVQGEIISLRNISGYTPMFPYYCLRNYFSSCCHANSATNLGSSSFTNGWYEISLTTNITIKGKMHNKAMLSNTGFLFFNDSASISPPKCFNFRALSNQAKIPSFSLFSQDLYITDGETDATSGRLYVEQFTTIDNALAMTATGVTNPKYALLISVVEAPAGTSPGGARQSGQMAFVANATHTDVILSYEKYTSTNDSCQIGALLPTADFLDIKQKQKEAGSNVAGSTHRLSIGPNVLDIK